MLLTFPGADTKNHSKRNECFWTKYLVSKNTKGKGKPDVMHAHFAGVGHTASKLKRKTGLPFVITEHTSSMMKPTIDQHLYKTANEAYASADALIAVSPGLRKSSKEDLIKMQYISPTSLIRSCLAMCPNLVMTYLDLSPLED